MISYPRGMSGVDGLFDKIRDIVTLKPLRKALSYAWDHVGEDVRGIVMTIGPIAAGVFLPGIGLPVAQVALGLLENDRLSDEERKRYKQALRDFIEQEEDAGRLPRGVIDIDNPDHLQAIVVAAKLPEDIRDDWFRQKGLAPPAAKPVHAAFPVKGAIASALLIGAGVALSRRGAA